MDLCIDLYCKRATDNNNYWLQYLIFPTPFICYFLDELVQLLNSAMLEHIDEKTQTNVMNLGLLFEINR